MEVKNTAYYERLLSQYVDDTISPEDRFILEKRALDDSFLFEAMEGLQNRDGANIKSIEELKSKIDHLSNKKRSRRIPLLNYGIAASLILLLGAGIWLFNTNITPVDSVAMNTPLILHEESSIRISTDSGEKELINKDQTRQVSESKRDHQKNQYDTPKAVISQVDNEAVLAEREADFTLVDETADEKIKAVSPAQNTTTKINPTVTEPDQGGEQVLSSPKLEATEIAVVEIEAPTAKVGDKIKEESIPKSSILKEEVLGDKSKSQNKRSTFNAARTTAAELALDKNEYIPSLDENIVVAPANGITSFMKGYNDIGIKKLSDEEVEIEFNLTESGEIFDVKVISSIENSCALKALDALKNSGKWVSLPKNSLASVRLKMPCF